MRHFLVIFKQHVLPQTILSLGTICDLDKKKPPMLLPADALQAATSCSSAATRASLLSRTNFWVCVVVFGFPDAFWRYGFFCCSTNFRY